MAPGFPRPVTHQTGYSFDPFGGLGITLVGHGAAAHPAHFKTLGHFVDFGFLQQEYFPAILPRVEQIMARRRTASAKRSRALPGISIDPGQLGHGPPFELPACSPTMRSFPQPPRVLQPGFFPFLFQTVQMASHFLEPAGGFEPEGNGQGMLAMRSSGHGGVRVFQGDLDKTFSMASRSRFTASITSRRASMLPESMMSWWWGRNGHTHPLFPHTLAKPDHRTRLCGFRCSAGEIQIDPFHGSLAEISLAAHSG